jgi:hypothetical protein
MRSSKRRDLEREAIRLVSKARPGGCLWSIEENPDADYWLSFAGTEEEDNRVESVVRPSATLILRVLIALALKLCVNLPILAK